ncbi:MAG: hypothetical protein MJ252_00190, partial [archaeon]|nr:hypothetical protein [archaeon]
MDLIPDHSPKNQTLEELITVDDKQTDDLIGSVEPPSKEELKRLEETELEGLLPLTDYPLYKMNFMKDLLLIIIYLPLSFLSFNFMNVLTLILVLFLIFFNMETNVTVVFKFKRILAKSFLFFNVIYLVAYFFCFILSFFSDEYYFFMKLFPLIERNHYFNITNFLISFCFYFIELFHYFILNWDYNTWIKNEKPMIQHILLALYPVKGFFYYFGLYALCVGSILNQNVVNYVLLIIVLLYHSFVFMFNNKESKSTVKKVSGYILLWIIIIVLIGIYAFNCPKIIKEVYYNKKSELYGLIFLYELNYNSDNYIYKIRWVQLASYICFFFSFITLTIFIKSKNLKVSKKAERKQIIYDDDIDKALADFFHEAKNLTIWKNVKLFFFKYCMSPSMFLHFTRIGIIVWLILYKEYVTLFMIIWLFLSMALNQRDKLLCLSQYFLSPLLIISYSLDYIYNIENLEPKFYIIPNITIYSKDSDRLIHMLIKFNIIEILLKYQSVQHKYLKNISKDIHQSANLVNNEIQRASESVYVLEIRDIFFKVCFKLIDISLIIFLYFSVCQTINVLNEVFLLFFFCLLIFDESYLDKFYSLFLYLINLSIFFKYIVYLYFNTKDGENYESLYYNIWSIFFYDNLKKEHFFWILDYLLYIKVVSKQSTLLKLSNSRIFSVYELIERNEKLHSYIKMALNVIADFIFGFYIWLLIPLQIICILLLENNLLFLIQLLISFIVYYKYISIVGKEFNKVGNIFMYTSLLICLSCIVFGMEYLCQLLNKKPFNIWTLVLTQTLKNNLEAIGLFIVDGNYGYTFFGYFMNLLLAVLIHHEIKRQTELNSKDNISNDQVDDFIKQKQRAALRTDNKRVILLLYYILHYFWIVIFAVITLLCNFWMLSVSMVLQIICFSIYIMKSFMNYYRCLTNNWVYKEAGLEYLLKKYREEKKEHFKITSKIQRSYFNLVWIISILCIVLSYLSYIMLKICLLYYNNNEDEEVYKNFQKLFYFTGLYYGNRSKKKLKFISCSWGYFLIIALFSIRAYFFSLYKQYAPKKPKEEPLNIPNKAKTFKPGKIGIDKNVTLTESFSEENSFDDQNNSKISKSRFSEFNVDQPSDALTDSRINDLNVRQPMDPSVLEDDSISDSSGWSNRFTVKAPMPKKHKISIHNKESEEEEEIEVDFGQDDDSLDDDMHNHIRHIVKKRKMSYDFKANFSLKEEDENLVDNTENQSQKNAKDDSHTKKKADFEIDEKLTKWEKKRNLRTKKYSLASYKLYKTVLEVILLSLLLFAAILRANFISFVYLFTLFWCYKAKNINANYMFAISLVVLSVLNVEYILFCINASSKTNPYYKEGAIDDVILPFDLKHIFQHNYGYFLNLGAERLQVIYTLMESIILIILYFYLEFFSFVLYENSETKTNKMYKKFQIRFLNSPNLDAEQYKRFVLAMKFSFDIDLDQFNNEMRDSTNKVKQKQQLSNYQTYLKHIREIFYLYYQFFFLATALFISVYSTDLLSLLNSMFSIVLIILTQKYYKGEKWILRLSIKLFFKPILFITFFLQFLFETPINKFLDEDLHKTLKALFGFNQTVEYKAKGEPGYSMDYYFIDRTFSGFLVVKLIMFFFMMLLEQIYNSYEFKKFILNNYLLFFENTIIKGKMSALLYNNSRVKLMEDRIKDNQEIDQTLKKIESMLIKWNTEIGGGNTLIKKKKTKDYVEEKEASLINSYRKKIEDEMKKLTIKNLIKKYWLVNLALQIHDFSNYLEEDKIRNYDCLVSILQGNVHSYSNLELCIKEYEEVNRHQFRKLEDLRTSRAKQLSNTLTGKLAALHLANNEQLAIHKDNEALKQKINELQLLKKKSSEEEEILKKKSSESSEYSHKLQFESDEEDKKEDKKEDSKVEMKEDKKEDSKEEKKEE